MLQVHPLPLSVQRATLPPPPPPHHTHTHIQTRAYHNTRYGAVMYTLSPTYTTICVHTLVRTPCRSLSLRPSRPQGNTRLSCTVEHGDIYSFLLLLSIIFSHKFDLRNSSNTIILLAVTVSSLICIGSVLPVGAHYIIFTKPFGKLLKKNFAAYPILPPRKALRLHSLTITIAIYYSNINYITFSSCWSLTVSGFRFKP